jgi:hypothetical protein
MAVIVKIVVFCCYCLLMTTLLVTCLYIQTHVLLNLNTSKSEYGGSMYSCTSPFPSLFALFLLADHSSKESYRLSISVRLRNLARGGLGPIWAASAIGWYGWHLYVCILLYWLVAPSPLLFYKEGKYRANLLPDLRPTFCHYPPGLCLCSRHRKWSTHIFRVCLSSSATSA